MPTHAIPISENIIGLSKPVNPTSMLEFFSSETIGKKANLRIEQISR